MAINKVIFGERTLIDLTNDTVTASSLSKGKTAHDKSGARIVGTSTFDVDSSSGTITPGDVLSGKIGFSKGTQVAGTMTNQGDKSYTISDKNQEIPILSGYYSGLGIVEISDREKEKLIPGNIKENITILGVTGTLPAADMVFFNGIQDNNGNPILDDKFDLIYSEEKAYGDTLVFLDDLLDFDGNKVLDNNRDPIKGRIVYKKYEEV